MRDFRSLKVWQKAHTLVLGVYRATTAFPREEMYGLTAQIRRAASSIAANISEGCGRNSPGDLARFCSIAMGSASELEYHILLARDLNLLKSETHDRLSEQIIEVKRMLTTFYAKLKADSQKLIAKT